VTSHTKREGEEGRNKGEATTQTLFEQSLLHLDVKREEEVGYASVII